MTQQISKSIIVNTPAHHAYAIWSDFTQFPHFMDHVKSVTVSGDGMSHWVVAGPLGSQIDWNAEITRQEPNTRIAWNTKNHKGAVTTSGQVTFNALAANQTEVTVTMDITPPGGKVGDWVAGVLADPEEAIATDLRRFKAYVETVEVTTS
jgi:uncharacterized membrane protein